MGLDSLMAVELRNRLQSSVGRPLPSTLAFDHPTVASIADFIASELGLATGADADGGPKADVARAAVTVAAMSEEEAEASLLQELAALDERKGERR